MTAFDWDNETWSQKLASRFFSSAFEGEPVTFAVDRRALAEITGLSEEEGVDALAAQVRQDVMPGYHFSSILRRTLEWRAEGCGGPPPSLPLLGLTVLAASGMSKFNFYSPLRRLLDPSDVGQGIPGDFAATIPPMWEQLRWWLDDELKGACGLSTIIGHRHFPFIGYSLQQVILRASDRPLLYRFFRAMGLEPGRETFAPAELRRALAIWSSRQGPRSARLHRLATDPALDGLAELVLLRAAEKWDGRLRDPKTGSQAATLRLLLELHPLELGLVAPRDHADPTSVNVTGPAGEVSSLNGEGSWFEPVPLPMTITPALLSEGTELSGTTLSFFVDPMDAIPFRVDDDLNEWVSTSRFTYGEKHHLLVRGAIREETERWITAEALEGTLDPSATARLPHGWFLFRGVRLLARPVAEPPAGLGQLLPSGGGGSRMRLVGGLQVLRLKGVYLTGGVPNVAFANTHEREHRFELRHGDLVPIERTSHSHEFPLERFWQLEEGRYQVVSGETTLAFDLIDSLLETPGPEVGSVILEGKAGGGARGYRANGPSPPPPATIAASESGAVLLGASPESVSNTQIPVWFMELAGYLSWTSLDGWDHDGDRAVWALVRHGSGPRQARLVRPEPPAGDGTGTSWAQLLLRSELAPGQGSDAEMLWQRYREAAGERA
jgi:hypothetical protein